MLVACEPLAPLASHYSISLSVYPPSKRTPMESLAADACTSQYHTASVPTLCTIDSTPIVAPALRVDIVPKANSLDHAL